MELSTPYVHIDLDIAERNIRRMAEELKKFGIDHRPHIKVHKSVEIARLQLALGAKGITVAKLGEAEVMAEGGVDDILIAFPIIGSQNLERLKKLAEKVKIRTILDSRFVAEGISRVGTELGQRIDILIELDGGIHRGGVQPGEAALNFAREISDLQGINIAGLFAYMGQIYSQKSRDAIREVAKMEKDILLGTKELLNKNGFNISITSGGVTPSSAYPEQLEGITESRAGNYIYYDMNAIRMGLAEEKDIALKIRSTVVSTPLPGYATIDAGSKTLTSDGSVAEPAFGYVCGMPGVKIVNLNEEHGYLRFDPEKYSLKVGDQLDIIPNHSCVISNLCDYIYGFRSGIFEKKIIIDARGKNY